jgi:hypothetical protein
VAQYIWWLASIVGLEQGLVNYIDNIQSRKKVSVIPEQDLDTKGTVSSEPRNTPEKQRQDHQDKVLKECKTFLQDSR